jgi:hypothetical protein
VRALEPIPCVEGEKPVELTGTLEISNSGGGTLRWSASTNAEWLSLSATSGNSTGEIDEVLLVADPSGLRAGHHDATITIVSDVAADVSQDVPVRLTIPPYHVQDEFSFHLNPEEHRLEWGNKSYEYYSHDFVGVTFYMKEHQKMQLSWFAYGDKPAVYVALLRPDGIWHAGGSISAGGPITSFSPGGHGDPGASGTLNFYCSSSHDEHSGAYLYPPGQYILNFEVYSHLLTPNSAVDVDGQYRIEEVLP